MAAITSTQREIEMAAAVLFSIAEDILKNLRSRALNKIASAWGFKSQLEKLKNTVTTIKYVLQDVEERQMQSRAICLWLERLKQVVYAADDLFDEFATTASRREVMGGSKLTKEVKTFFSHSNQIAFAVSISHKAKKIREEVDDILRDGRQFAFLLQSCGERSVARRSETYSFVDAQQVIGRDDDKKAILGVLDQYQGQRVCVVCIVGMGGIGKTTLAQLIYNDDKVKKQFDLRSWVCVSENFDVKEIVRKILMSTTNTEPHNLGLDQLIKQMREQVIGKKYFLVLDDVWNEDREKWLQLGNLLDVGRDGSKILATTRSWEVAKIMSTVPCPYALKSLQEEDSWSLFKKMAFEHGEGNNNPELLNIGKEIVHRCAHVPLAIKILGSLLYGKDEIKWLHFKEKSLAHMSKCANDIMNILKLSYDHLGSSLKNCFAYCALFPKDFKFNKETLIYLWMAQGFLIPTDESQSLEDVGEEYFLLLLQRCFFQDVTRDKWGHIESCKMHDLIHDLAIMVAGLDCKVAKFGEMDFDNRIHHLSFGYHLAPWQKIPRTVLNLKVLRTFLLPEQIYDGTIFSRSMCHRLLSSCTCLRVLDLHNLRVKSLPNSIGRLIHLRYLDLSRTSIEKLPSSVTKLQNLQTLILYECFRLRKLPAEFRGLLNLRSFDVRKCPLLTQMPSGLGALTSLRSLPLLLVNCRNSGDLSYKISAAQFWDLKNLNNLRGSLRIKVKGELNDPAHEAREANLISKHGLLKLHIEGDSTLREAASRSEHDEALLEALKPHSNLKELTISCYIGEKFPSWAMDNKLHTTLPNLVEIELNSCRGCQQVPSFGRLPFLKCLSLVCLDKVEYIDSGLSEGSLLLEETPFFPSLKELKLSYMDNLKGWWAEVEVGDVDGQTDLPVRVDKVEHRSRTSFSKLSRLYIKECPNLNLNSLPLFPNVDDLTLVNVNETLLVLKTPASSTPSAASTSTSCGYPSKLKSLCISDVEVLVFLPRNFLSHLSSLQVLGSNLQCSFELEEVFRSSNSLIALSFYNCRELRSISRGLEHLTMLKTLVLGQCGELDLLLTEDMEAGMPWKALKNLQYLTFDWIPKLVNLPDGLQHVTNLRCLCLESNINLVALPEWISCFSSLVQMEIHNCPKLSSFPERFGELTSLHQLEIIANKEFIKRCQSPDGEDWPKIKHIPFLIIKEAL